MDLDAIEVFFILLIFSNVILWRTFFRMQVSDRIQTNKKIIYVISEYAVCGLADITEWHYLFNPGRKIVIFPHIIPI